MKGFLKFGRKKPAKIEKEDFYRNKYAIKTEWWLDSCSLPELRWARLRVFNDKSADACFGEKEKIYAFENREYASSFLSKDEYISLDRLNSDAEREYGLAVETIKPPLWKDGPEQDFEYLGKY